MFSTHHPMIDFGFSVSGNYFDTELLTQSWNTIGTPIEVQYYRRPLTELFNAIESSGMTVASLNEGVPDKRMKEVSEETCNKLSTSPGFVFLMCRNGKSNGSKERTK